MEKKAPSSQLGLELGSSAYAADAFPLELLDEFGFDGMMYRLVDSVAMGSPLGPVLANIFMGYCEAKVSC